MKDKTLNIIEIYSSLQGETSLSGRMTSFVRLQGCPLQCSWCDSTFSHGKGEPWTFSEIFTKIRDFSFPHVCVTGGEPLIQPNVIPLMEELTKKNCIVSLETSGAFSTENVPEKVKIILDIKCPGSGMEGKNLWENLDRLRPHDEVKFVIVDKADYEYTKRKIEDHNLLQKAEILISPVFGLLDPKELVLWLQEDKLPVRVNLQLHKYVWNKDQRGV